MRRLVLIGCAALLVLPVGLHAQRKRDTYIVFDACCWMNRWMLEPYGGVVKDSYEIGGPKSASGILVGVHVGFRLSERTRLIGNVGYSDAGNVTSSNELAGFYTYHNVWAITTAGAEFDVVPGRASAAVGLQAGVGWRRLQVDDTVGIPLGPPDAEQNFTATVVILPSLTVRYWITSRAGMSLALADQVFDVFDGPAQNSPSLTLAVMFR